MTNRDDPLGPPAAGVSAGANAETPFGRARMERAFAEIFSPNADDYTHGEYFAPDYRQEVDGKRLDRDEAVRHFKKMCATG